MLERSGKTLGVELRSGGGRCGCGCEYGDG